MSRAKRTPLSAQDKTRWREKVREECMQRVKQHRQGVLWRMRQVSQAPQSLLTMSSDRRGSARGACSASGSSARVHCGGYKIEL